MGCFYVGYNNRALTKGSLKIGESNHQTPRKRISNIKSKESFEGIGFLVLINETKAERLFVESYVRMYLERVHDLIHKQNDHFNYEIGKRCSYAKNYKIAKEFSELALAYGEKACEVVGIQCIRHYLRDGKIYMVKDGKEILINLAD